MKIGVDIDDVLAEFNTNLFIFVNQKYKTNYNVNDMFSYDFRIAFPGSEIDFFNECFSFYESDKFKVLPIVKGAKKGVKQLKKSHKLYAISSRPDPVKEITLNWFKKNFPNTFDQIIFTNQFSNDPTLKTKLKSDICIELGVELMIEDAPHHAEDISKQNIDVLLLEKPWNKSYIESGRIKKVKSWRDILQEVDSRV